MTEEKEPTVPEKKVAKERKPRTVKPKMVSYSMKMTIPTGQYANIVPEIVVKGGTMEDAHHFIAPHMNKLWKEYYLINERRPKPAPVAPSPEPPPSGVALVKATQAIESCVSKEALKLIIDRIHLSVKLTDEDKKSLLPLIDTKYNQLNEIH